MRSMAPRKGKENGLKRFLVGVRRRTPDMSASASPFPIALNVFVLGEVILLRPALFWLTMSSTMSSPYVRQKGELGRKSGMLTAVVCFLSSGERRQPCRLANTAVTAIARPTGTDDFCPSNHKTPNHAFFLSPEVHHRRALSRLAIQGLEETWSSGVFGSVSSIIP